MSLAKYVAPCAVDRGKPSTVLDCRRPPFVASFFFWAAFISRSRQSSKVTMRKMLTCTILSPRRTSAFRFFTTAPSIRRKSSSKGTTVEHSWSTVRVFSMPSSVRCSQRAALTSLAVWLRWSFQPVTNFRHASHWSKSGGAGTSAGMAGFLGFAPMSPPSSCRIGGGAPLTSRGGGGGGALHALASVASGGLSRSVASVLSEVDAVVLGASLLRLSSIWAAAGLGGEGGVRRPRFGTARGSRDTSLSGPLVRVGPPRVSAAFALVDAATP
mmetsp:Transcript_19046/g.37401  ORF Transcript_19046/g.37401 Transcript_19046/m.37401 type:complete len:270 (-) Transcript_19046:1323-2132(-)